MPQILIEFAVFLFFILENYMGNNFFLYLNAKFCYTYPLNV